MAEECPCCSGKPYAQCCQPWHAGEPAPTPEQLMRSRYCAYTLQLIDYLVQTTVPAQQSLLAVEPMAHWSRASRWLGLSVEKADAVTDVTRSGQVTFVARWADPDGSEHSHRECSDFRRIGKRWYFVDPNHPIQTGRNGPCPCGSTRKFKHCCAG